MLGYPASKLPDVLCILQKLENSKFMQHLCLVDTLPYVQFKKNIFKHTSRFFY